MDKETIPFTVFCRRCCSAAKYEAGPTRKYVLFESCEHIVCDLCRKKTAQNTARTCCPYCQGVSSRILPVSEVGNPMKFASPLKRLGEIIFDFNVQCRLRQRYIKHLRSVIDTYKKRLERSIQMEQYWRTKIARRRSEIKSQRLRQTLFL